MNHNEESKGPEAATPPVSDQMRMAVWFRIMLGILFLLVVVGGTVRLTHSGMSIPHWPIIYYGEENTQGSFLPPVNEAQWERVSQVYHEEVVHKNDPERNLSMAQVKKEFWIEYSHRAVAGLFGIVFLAVFIQVMRKPALRKSIGWLLVGAAAVLGTQVTLGGLTVLNHTHPLYVSVHLTTAFIFVSFITWCMLKLSHPPDVPVARRAPYLTRTAWFAAGVCLLQVWMGGVVAKTQAGKSFNTWPHMGEGGPIIPPMEALFQFSPWYVNYIENEILIQFIHRWLAFVVLGAVIFLTARLLTKPLTRAGRWTLRALMFTVVFQILLGIITLLEAVPIILGILHLVTGLVLFQLIIVMVYEVRTNAAILALEEAEINGTDEAPQRVPDAETARVS